jgi:hypothetical protein
MTLTVLSSAPASGGQIDTSIWHHASQTRRSDFLAKADVPGEFEQSDVVILHVWSVVRVQNHLGYRVVHWAGAILLCREIVFAQAHHTQTSFSKRNCTQKTVVNNCLTS